jgi:uncharacterized protein YneF (UPF0154 family)
MDKKIRRFLIMGLIILLGMFGGYWIAINTTSILELSPESILLIGVGLGIIAGYVIGFATGIMRVINVTQKEDVSLPSGKLKFRKTKN